MAVQIGKLFKRKIVIIFLPINLNMCFGCSKEPSPWDGSFEYPQHMVCLRTEKNYFQLRTLIWRPELWYILFTKHIIGIPFVYETFSMNICRLLITFANRLDPDQAGQNVEPDLDPICLALRWHSWKNILKKLILKKINRRQLRIEMQILSLHWMRQNIRLFNVFGAQRAFRIQ